MIQFSIVENGQKYSYPQSLEDVTLRKYIDYLTFIEPQMPKCLQDIRDAETEEESLALEGKITQRQEVKEILPYFAKFIEFWTGLSAKTILGADGGKSMRVDHMKALFLEISKALHNVPEYEYQQIMEHNGEYWYLPEEFMATGTFIEYAEASTFKYEFDRVAGGDWLGLPNLMCVILRKKDELYSDKLLKRAEMFMDWPMSKVYYIAFFLLKLNERYITSLETYLAALKASKLKQELKN